MGIIIIHTHLYFSSPLPLISPNRRRLIHFVEHLVSVTMIIMNAH